MKNPSVWIRSEVRKTHGYSLKKQNDRIKLNQNESPYDISDLLKGKVLERLKSAAWNRYPLPYAIGLAEKIARREGWVSDGIVVSGGSNILIQALVVAASVGAKVLTITPSFSLYELQAKMLGNRVIEIPLNKRDFSLPTEKILKRIRREKPRLVFLPNPNAPTGNLFPEKDLLSIIQASKSLVVIDEAYYPFSGYTFAPLLKKYKNLVLLRTFSKAFSLGGVRLGYLMADPTVAREVQKVVLPFSVGILSQVLGEVVLEDEGYVGRVVAEAVDERNRMQKELEKMKDLKVFPSQTNFILFQTKTDALFQKIQTALSRKGIVIRDVRSKHLRNALRISVGSPRENDELLSNLRNCCPESKPTIYR